MASYANRVRRGLPRAQGGEPWPPAEAIISPIVSDENEASEREATGQDAVAEPTVTHGDAAATLKVAPAAKQQVTAHEPSALVESDVRVRRGLPRTPGGEPWPPADFAAASRVVEDVPEQFPEAALIADAGSSVPPEETAAEIPAPATEVAALSEPLAFRPTVWPGKYADVHAAAPQPKRYGKLTALQWFGAVVGGGIALLGAAAMAVVFTRWLVSTEPVEAFIDSYPGHYPLPEGTSVGFPAWVQWQHFFNVFLMVLIIRTGLTVRKEKRPSVFWSPKGNKRRRISLTMWFHQALDVLWMINGAIFIVMLFITGHWVRLVPTSWEVFPNAVSAALQYLSLDWPTDNGWVNYNSLQQLTYFTTVFIAAPLAILTGIRMSGFWTKRLDGLSKVYPVEWARALHFPVMLYFIFFIVVHVALVFATGALRNLNHMYGGTDVVNWAGFWIFFASLVVIVVGWIAARPLVLAPIAKLFGTVKGR